MDVSDGVDTDTETYQNAERICNLRWTSTDPSPERLATLQVASCQGKHEVQVICCANVEIPLQKHTFS